MSVDNLEYVHLTFTAPNGEGEVDVPTLDDPTDRFAIERAARRAWASLVHTGYGDVDEVQLFHNGQPVTLFRGTR